MWVWLSGCESRVSGHEARMCGCGLVAVSEHVCVGGGEMGGGLKCRCECG